MIMMQGNLFTIKNVQQNILQQQPELFPLEIFDWLEPIIRSFHLKMNLLLILFNKL